MKNISTYGGKPVQRHLTGGCLLKNKAAGKLYDAGYNVCCQ